MQKPPRVPRAEIIISGGAFSGDHMVNCERPFPVRSRAEIKTYARRGAYHMPTLRPQCPRKTQVGPPVSAQVASSQVRRRARSIV